MGTRVCNHFLWEKLRIGMHDLAKAVTQGHLICQKVNQKVMRKAIAGGKELAQSPFQNIQTDFTEMPPVENYKHLSVIADHLTHWVETISTRKETAEADARIILENIIPLYGLVSNTDSDRGPHFITQVLHKKIEALGIK